MTCCVTQSTALPWNCLAGVNSRSHDDDDVADDLWCCWQEAGFLAWKSLQCSDLPSNDTDTVTSHRCVARLIYMHTGWAGDTGSGRTRGAASTPVLHQLLTPVNGCTAQTQPPGQTAADGWSSSDKALQTLQKILSSNIWLHYGGIIRNQLCSNNNCQSKHRQACLWTRPARWAIIR